MGAPRTDGHDASRPSARAGGVAAAGGSLAVDASHDADAASGPHAEGEGAGHGEGVSVRRLGRGEAIVIVGPAADVSACAREHGFVVVEVATAAAAIEQVEAEPPHCAIVVAQLLHRGPSDLAQALRRAAPRAWFPVVLLEPSAQARDRDEPQHDEFDDVLAHDEGPRRLALRLRSLVRLKHKHDSMGGQTRVLLSRNTALAQELRVRNEELERLTVGLVGALEKANLLNDEDTGNHIRRVCHFSRLLAERARLGGELTDKIFRYASLHDVGKV